MNEIAKQVRVLIAKACTFPRAAALEDIALLGDGVLGREVSHNPTDLTM